MMVLVLYLMKIALAIQKCYSYPYTHHTSKIGKYFIILEKTLGNKY